MLRLGPRPRLRLGIIPCEGVEAGLFLCVSGVFRGAKREYWGSFLDYVECGGGNHEWNEMELPEPGGEI
jgi:hypothetical protein